MKTIERMLVAIEDEDHGEFVIEKAFALRDHANATPTFARIHYDHVIDDPVLGFSPEEHDRVVRLETQAEQIKFQHFVSMYARDGNWRAEVVWSKQPWRGIIDLAHRGDCRLIVKDAYVERRLLQVIHTAHDWNLLRYADMPVMMIKPVQWVAHAVVLAAIDVVDPNIDALNQRILRYANDLTEMLGGTLYVANALPLSRRLVMEQHRGEDYERFIADICAQRLGQIERLLTETHISGARVQIVEGTPHTAIAEVTKELKAELLVIGKSRLDVAEYLGTTSERLLHSVNSDVVSIA
jgi:nucleotide-binding universal stress UspA family protein